MTYIACIDPGHNSYGKDTGAESQGYKEQDFTLDICLKMKPLLLFNGIKPVLTREGPTVNGPYQTLNQSLQTRYNISNNAGADIFVSVHINAGGGTGTEVLIYAKGGQAERLAEHVLPELIAVSGWTNRGIKERTNVGVLGSRVNAPSILTENGFIDSSNDIVKLKNPDFRQALAVAHVKGICKYFGVEYREEVEDVLDVAVLLNTKDDFWAGADVAFRNGGCAIFTRFGTQIPKDAWTAKKLIVIGGPTTHHSNEVLLSGNDKYDTAAAVKKYLG